MNEHTKYPTPCPKFEISTFQGLSVTVVSISLIDISSSPMMNTCYKQVQIYSLPELVFNMFVFLLIIIRMQERQVKEQQIEHAKKILKIQEQLKTNLAQVHVHA